MKALLDADASAVDHRPHSVPIALAAATLLALAGTRTTGSGTSMDGDTLRGTRLGRCPATLPSNAMPVLSVADDAPNPVLPASIDRRWSGSRAEPHVAPVVDPVRQSNGGVLPTSTAGIAAAQERMPNEVLARNLPSGSTPGPRDRPGSRSSPRSVHGPSRGEP